MMRMSQISGLVNALAAKLSATSEGAWTPTVTCDLSNTNLVPTVTFNSNESEWYKVGKIFHYSSRIRISFSGIGSLILNHIIVTMPHSTSQAVAALVSTGDAKMTLNGVGMNKFPGDCYFLTNNSNSMLVQGSDANQTITNGDQVIINIAGSYITA